MTVLTKLGTGVQILKWEVDATVISKSIVPPILKFERSPPLI